MITSSKHRFYILESPLSLSSYTSVCIIGQPEPVDSVLTFPSGYDTLKYSWVKATAVSVHLRILFMTLQSTNNLHVMPTWLSDCTFPFSLTVNLVHNESYVAMAFFSTMTYFEN